jgi:hypothetical protein
MGIMHTARTRHSRTIVVSCRELIQSVYGVILSSALFSMDVDIYTVSNMEFREIMEKGDVLNISTINIIQYRKRLYYVLTLSSWSSVCSQNSFRATT